MFTIGEFSKFCCISARMLRHYDRIGLLHPAKIDEINGYRYYDSSQLGDFTRIEKLKKYGFTLSEIKRLLPLTDSELRLQTTLQYERLKDQLAQLLQTISQMEADLSLSKEESVMNQNYHVIVMNNPAQRIFSIKRTIAIKGEEIHQLISDLYSEAKKRGLHQNGFCQLAYYGNEFNEERMEVEAQLSVAEDHPDTTLLPESLCVTTVHKGPLEMVHNAYAEICRYLDEHPEYQITGVSFERYLKTESMASSPEELETAVLFPVIIN